MHGDCNSSVTMHSFFPTRMVGKGLTSEKHRGNLTPINIMEKHRNTGRERNAYI